jgi:ketosteroid isomerase-like protein
MALRSRVLLLTCLAAAPGCGRDPVPAEPGAGAAVPVPSASRAVRETLLAAETALHDAARAGFATAIGERLADDAVLLLPGSPLIYGGAAGRERLGETRTLTVPALLGETLQAEVAGDGRVGYTWGWYVLPRPEGALEASAGRYLAAWRRAAEGPWQIGAVALLLALPGATATAAAAPSPTAPGIAQELLAADRAFAARAASEGVGAAFGALATPTAVLVTAAGELPIGPAAIAAGFADWPAGAALEWAPVYGFAAASGDLGFTVGEAIFRRPGADGRPVESGTKYLTIWRRQPDGEWRYAADGGNARPAPAG